VTAVLGEVKGKEKKSYNAAVLQKSELKEEDSRKAMSPHTSDKSWTEKPESGGRMES
jgi:hypothetical protein